MKTTEWIDAKYIDKEYQSQLKNHFSNAKPFKFLELKGFFIAEKLNPVITALLDEKFIHKSADLFQLSQTQDFQTIENPILKEFRDFIYSSEFRAFIQAITGISTSDTVDMAGSLYQDTDYLLCHDDQLEGRKIAYLFYLSSMEEGEGGSLNLFNHEEKEGKQQPGEIATKIIPKVNTFTFFEVSPISFHEVEEVVVKKDRLAIGGWFHG